MAKFDVETLLKKSHDVIKTNLNNELILIDTEKNDFVMPKINDNAYFLQNLNNNVFNYENFVVYGLVSNNEINDNNYNNTLETIRVGFEVFSYDDGAKESENVFYKMLRYSRALKSASQKNFDKIQRGIKFQVRSLEPTQFDLNGRMMRSSGVIISAAISAE